MRQPSVERCVGTPPIFLVTRRQTDVSAFAVEAQIGGAGGGISLITMMLGSFFSGVRRSVENPAARQPIRRRHPANN